MMKAYSSDGLRFRTVPNDYQAADGEVVFADTPSDAQLRKAFPGYAAASDVKAATAARAGIMAQLEALDAFLPRALEDYWTASGFDTTKLPQIQQARLAEKQSLRGQLAGTT